VEHDAAGIVAALAAAVFAAGSAANRTTLAALFAAAAVAGAAAFASPRAVEADAIAFSIVAASAAAFAWPRWALLRPLAGGIFAAAWVSISSGQGLPWLPAAMLAGSILAVTAWLAVRRPGFVTPSVHDEALVLVGGFALLVAIGPAVVDGWRSAVVLTAEPLTAESPNVGPWLGALAIGSLLLGGAYSFWKRR
jgi:hypothetical protein